MALQPLLNETGYSNGTLNYQFSVRWVNDEQNTSFMISLYEDDGENLKYAFLFSQGNNKIDVGYYTNGYQEGYTVLLEPYSIPTEVTDYEFDLCNNTVVFKIVDGDILFTYTDTQILNCDTIGVTGTPNNLNWTNRPLSTSSQSACGGGGFSSESLRSGSIISSSSSAAASSSTLIIIIVVVIVVILLLAGLGLGGYFWWRHNQNLKMGAA
jgi:hypothetical protein